MKNIFHQFNIEIKFEIRLRIRKESFTWLERVNSQPWKQSYISVMREVAGKSQWIFPSVYYDVAVSASRRSSSLIAKAITRLRAVITRIRRFRKAICQWLSRWMRNRNGTTGYRSIRSRSDLLRKGSFPLALPRACWCLYDDTAMILVIERSLLPVIVRIQIYHCEEDTRWRRMTPF